jgi:hypothetical protein
MNSVRYVSSGRTFLDGEILYIELPGDDYAVPSNVLYVQGVRARLVEKDLAPKVNYFAGCTIALYSSIVCYILFLQWNALVPFLRVLFMQWDPPALEFVSEDMVDSYFAPLGEFDAELKLPTELREAFV